jgi:hypothetical protein
MWGVLGNNNQILTIVNKTVHTTVISEYQMLSIFVDAGRQGYAPIVEMLAREVEDYLTWGGDVNDLIGYFEHFATISWTSESGHTYTFGPATWRKYVALTFEHSTWDELLNDAYYMVRSKLDLPRVEIL